jgi:hypothetical protein
MPDQPPAEPHIITLSSGSAQLTHPAECPAGSACPYTDAATRLREPFIATGGTWTCSLDNDVLILLRRIAI